MMSFGINRQDSFSGERMLEQASNQQLVEFVNPSIGIVGLRDLQAMVSD